ncbi:hypothetical protein N7520_001757 [Penicillium odoratum]|uniref:uncharacterized protein n=1 Tax=Penicillium odoratum TaxID=1167516 RepID=UPI0025485351|nr:uncharacterized protein N7520_001757 [Penicillium odoratum]KAJ5778511.1 hypothetical protein N7520_001757 [Penicillium odoratum]
MSQHVGTLLSVEMTNIENWTELVGVTLNVLEEACSEKDCIPAVATEKSEKVLGACVMTLGAGHWIPSVFPQVYKLISSGRKH